MKVNAAIKRLGSESAFSVMAQANELKAQGREILNLAIGAPDFHTPQNIIDAAKTALDGGQHFYTPVKGTEICRSAVQRDIRSRRNIDVNIDQILVTPGAKPTINYAIKMFGEQGTEILYPDPGFPIYRSLIEYTGAKAIAIPHRAADGFSFQSDELLSLINEKTRLIILNSPSNPTGQMISRATMDQLALGLKKWPSLPILSDEIYSRLIYGSVQHTSPYDYQGLRERTILMDGWSKTYSMTGWRLGYGVWPKSLIDYAERLQINDASCANSMVQFAGAEALLGAQEHALNMHDKFDKRRKLIVRLLNELPGFECAMPDGAFYAFPNIEQTEMSSNELQTHLLHVGGVATLSGSGFGLNGEGHLRLSYAASSDIIEAAVNRIRECLN